MRCEKCRSVPLTDIHTPQEYILCVGSLTRMVLAGDAEIVYQNCPLDRLMDKNNRWVKQKLFHQFRCTGCGTVYGMLFNTSAGGQIKINDKIFDPEDYPDPSEKEKDGK